MQPPSQPRPALPLLLLYLAAVLVGGAFLAPLLFDLGKWAQVWLPQSALRSWGLTQWLLSEIERAHFTRYFNRAVLVLAIALIWPVLKALRLDRRVLPTLAPLASGFRQGLGGFLLAAGLLFGLGLLLIQNGYYMLKPDAAWLRLSAPFTAAFSVGIVEELFFRGALLGIFLRTMSTQRAFGWCTFLFAIVHFLRPPSDWQLADAEVRWHSGFAVLAQLFSGFGSLRIFLAEFLTLTAVGAVLAHARLHTGRLWLPIGLHAGWVFGLKYCAALTLPSKLILSGSSLPWIGTNLKIGLAPFLTVLFTGFLISKLFSRAMSPPQ